MKAVSNMLDVMKAVIHSDQTEILSLESVIVPAKTNQGCAISRAFVWFESARKPSLRFTRDMQLQTYIMHL